MGAVDELGLKARPKYSSLSANYAKIARKSAGDSFSMIGGDLLKMYLDGKFYNACASRMSYGLNKTTGHNIPSGTIFADRAIYRLKGGDGKPYMPRVSDMSYYVENIYDGMLLPSSSPQDAKQKFKGKKGIIIFRISGSSKYTGHITIWNGSTCLDGHCYFEESYKTSLLELP